MHAALQGRRAAFAGQSGVWKSSLLNALVPEAAAKVGSLSERLNRGLGRGRHTTSVVRLYPLGATLTDGTLIDAQGLRRFVPLPVSAWALARTFPDVAAAAEHCRFRDCAHDQEPGCGVQAALADGTLSAERATRYRQCQAGPGGPMNPNRCLSLDAFDALTAAAPGRCLLDVGTPQRFTQAHLPGARLLNPRIYSGLWARARNPRAPESLRQTLAGALGPEAWAGKARVVLYDDGAPGPGARCGPGASSALKHGPFLMVALSPGPRPAAPRAGPTAGALHCSRRATPKRFPNPEPWATLEGVEVALDADTHCLWDARSPAEYAGFQRTAARNGHIPGAVNVPITTLLDPKRSGRLRADLKDWLSESGIDGTRPIITHCHSHHRSGLSYLAGRLLGWPIRAYAGSWGEWGNHPTTPIAEGPHPHD